MKPMENEYFKGQQYASGNIEYCEDPITLQASPVPSAITKRLGRDRMFMDIASVVAQRGTCDRARVGAVLVDKNYNIVSIGYNGAPAGMPHCDEVGHVIYNGHCIRTIHAEENCISKVKLEPQSYTMYVTHYPCIKCQGVMFEKVKEANAKLLVVYGASYNNSTAFSHLADIHDTIEFSKFKGLIL